MTADTETIREALDMLDVLSSYAGISLKQPPDEVFRHLQRLHGLPEVGGPPERDPRAALGRVEDELRLTREILWMTVTEDDHECQGYCPDAGYEDSRDPNCAACRAMDLPESPLMAEFVRALSSALGSGEERE